MTLGGAKDGNSNRVRKDHSRRLESFRVNIRHGRVEDPFINFGPEDLEGVAIPQDDALVVRAIIINYDVARVFINSGSSVNILFKEVLDWMQVDLVKLHPMSTSLFGFVGHEIKPPRQINLPLSLGEKPLRRSHAIVFTVVEATLAYNIILARLTMSSFKSMALTYHQKVKFSVGERIGEV